jgi:ABC-type uncharacterized transport system substrate-binding protein
MKRREFLKIACGFVGAWPLAAHGQPPGNQRLIGILGADATVWRPWTGAFVAHLKELGWVEGDTAAIEYRWATGRSDRVSEIAAEFERRKVDVIVTYGAAVPVLRQTITSIPIVFAVAFDPVRGGLVQSLAHPAGNITGVSITAFATLRNKADALYVVSDALIAANRARIVTLALSERLPTIMSYDDYVEAGGLMSYGPDYADLFRRAADMVNKILRGTKPGDIPVEQPTKFELAINVRTAATLGLTIPQTLLATADEVIK